MDYSISNDTPTYMWYPYISILIYRGTLYIQGYPVYKDTPTFRGTHIYIYMYLLMYVRVSIHIGIPIYTRIHI